MTTSIVSIESDGTSSGTYVKAANGDVIGMVQSIKIDISAQSEFATATIILARVPFKVEIKETNVIAAPELLTQLLEKRKPNA